MEETSQHKNEERLELLEESGVETLTAEPLTAATDTECQLELSTQLAAVLFSSSRPITLTALARITETDEEAVEDALAEVRGMFDGKVHGFALCEVAGGYQFRTDPEATSVIRRLVPTKTKRLSKAAAETLAIVAYKQPVQRGEIESIRGVDALPTLKTLLDQKLVRVIGHENAIGQPTLYGTTEYFLERFGLKDLSGLPTEREILVLEDETGEMVDADDVEDEIETATVETTESPNL